MSAMTFLHDFFIAPLADENFRRALVACLAIAVSGAPLGVFLVIRRMTLLGDTISHAILPGVAVAFLLTGESVWPMTGGGLLAGVVVALIAGLLTRATPLKEDAGFAVMYLVSVALGMLLLSLGGGDEELLHMLFGNVYAITADSLTAMLGMVSFNLIVLAVIYRGLMLECFDPLALRVGKGGGALYHELFLMLVVVTLVAAFHAMGTLLALGVILLPAITARLWAQTIDAMVLLSVGIGALSAPLGLFVSHYFGWPPSSCVVLSGSVFFLCSVLFGSHGGVFTRYFPAKHYVD